METLQAIGKSSLTVIAIILITMSFVRKLDEYYFTLSIWRRFTVKVFLETLAVIALMLGVAWSLWQVPGFKYGWLHLFFRGGGNLQIRPLLEHSASDGLLPKVMSVLFLLALLYLIPFWAEYEERWFRSGHYKWKPIVKQSIKFGLMHCLVGVPLAVGIALIVTGLFYGFKYKKAYEANVISDDSVSVAGEALLISTTYHSMYNTILATAGLIALPFMYIAT